MQIITYVAIVLGLLAVVRSISLASLQNKLIGYRDKGCIARIVQQQKACDKIVRAYYVVVVLIGLWIMALGLHIAIVKSALPVWAYTVLPACLCCLCAAYFIYRASLMKKFDLVRFYDEMKAYRQAQEVVTADNDHEVNFIRAYNKAVGHTKYMLFWIVVILAVSAWFFFMK